MLYIFSQISGYIALLLICISYFCKNKKRFLIYQTIADIGYAMAYIFINVWVAGIITIFSSIRCIVFYICENKGIKHKAVSLPIFISIYCIITIVLWQGYGDILPLITATIYTVVYAIKNIQVIRYLSIVPSVALCIYNICFRLYSSAILDLFEIVVLIISIIHFKKKNTQEK